MKNGYRKLDNTARYFSLEDQNYKNVFRLSILLREKVNMKILKKSIIQTLKKYPNYKVKMKSGFFWHFLEYNPKFPILEKEKTIPCKNLDFKKNNDFLFKVTYYNKKINLEIYHVLTDGVGATVFLQELIANYFNIKYDLAMDSKNKLALSESFQDEYIKSVDYKMRRKRKNKPAFLIKAKTDPSKNKTNHYIINLKEFKRICKKYKVSITEFLTALYIKALYKNVYDKKSKKDIAITVPIDLRKRYKKEALTNFFVNMNIMGNVKNEEKISFKKLLKQVHKEFKEKLSIESIKVNLANDVKLGTNKLINAVPLFIKKFYMKYMDRTYSGKTTTTLSNIGAVNILEKYKKYIENILILVSPGKYQKAKCTICSYENHLNITINSSLVSNKLEEEFYKLLVKYIGDVKLINNNC